MAYVYRCVECEQCYIRETLELEPPERRRCLKCGLRDRFLRPPSGPPAVCEPLLFRPIQKSDHKEGHRGA